MDYERDIIRSCADKSIGYFKYDKLLKREGAWML